MKKTAVDLENEKNLPILAQYLLCHRITQPLYEIQDTEYYFIIICNAEHEQLLHGQVGPLSPQVALCA